jgi:hypothetical protein
MTIKEAILQTLIEQKPGSAYYLTWFTTAYAEDENGYDTDSFDVDKFAERIAELLKQQK